MAIHVGVLLLTVFIGSSFGKPRLSGMSLRSASVKDESVLARIARQMELQRVAGKLHEKREQNDDGLKCYKCANSNGQQSCTGSYVTCQPGEVCATVWHTDNTNYDGCMAKTICEMLSNTNVAHSRCCSTELCNMLK